MKKRALPLLLAAVLLLTLIPLRAGAASDIYFTAINDNLLPLTSGTMPAWVDGVLYVPYTVFDSSYTGSNLRINWNQNRSSNTFTLYTLNDTLVFDMNQNNSKNAHTGELFYYKAITRNGKVYVPIAFVCSFFGLGLSRISTPYGELVRIKNASVVLSDKDFTDGAASLMEIRLKRYQQSLVPSDPDTSDDPGTTPGVSDDPDDGSHSSARVYLAIACQQGGELHAMLDVLDNYTYTALFLVRPDDLEALAGPIRRAVASGHTVGFLLGEDEASPQTMEQANEALFAIAYTKTAVYSLTGGDTSALAAAGYIAFSSNVDGTLSASRIMSRVAARSGKVRILFPSGGGAASKLSQVVRQLRQDDYTIRPAVEPEF